MLTKSQIQDLKDFASAIAVPLSNTDPDKWPIRAGRVGKFCLGEFSEEFFSDVAELKRKKWSMEKIAKLFDNPSHLWPMAHHLLTGFKMNNLPLEKQQENILNFIELEKNLKYGNPFCKDKKNIVWSPKELVINTKNMNNDISKSKLVHILSGILWSYAEVMYFVANDVALEIHGPYKLKDGCDVLVRDLINLHPKELWPSIKSFLPYEKITVITAYKKFDAWLDVYNNLYLNPGMSLIKEITSWKVLVNNKEISQKEIEKLIQEVGKPIEEVSSLVDLWDIKQIAKQYINVFWYRKKALREALGKDWKPDPKILDRVDKEDIPDPIASNPTYEELKKKFTLL